MGIIMSFIITTQVSFTDDRIFPMSKRNTSVGTCGMIARSVTIFAPICNEWPSPIPVLMMLGFSILGLMTSVTFPNENEFTPGTVQKDLKYDYLQANEEESEPNPESTARSFFDEPLDERLETVDTGSFDRATSQMLNKAIKV